ncbi:MAG: LPS export ABC transporter ATP-binding protein [Planctomycetota bacterium]|nr:LPS export ABC transporter ATP-binding protein [Planctomycetota bacterium]
MELLNVTGLTKIYGGRKVVDDVSFSVNEAEIVGLLGKNGAGKTTSFKMTMGMIPTDGGRVIFEGDDVSRLPMYQRARRGLGYLAQEPSVFQRLTVKENLLAILEMMHLARSEREAIASELVRDFGLTHLSDQHARTLSGGERRRLELARALVTRPSLMLLDEPFTGVDPIAIFDIQGFIRNLKNRGIGVLVTDHNVHATLGIVDRAYIINEGRVFRHGTSDELINDPEVKRVYLGATFKGDEFSAATTSRERQ